MDPMSLVAYLALGVVGALLLIAYAARFRPGQDRILAQGLVGAALIYVGFAVWHGHTAWLAVEVAGVLAYGTFAWLGVRRSPAWIAIGWGLHPLWDAGLHLFGPISGVAPTWYAIACISFDVVVAIAILRPSESESPTVPR